MISAYLPQMYKDKVKSDAAKTPRAAKPALAEKAKKAVKILKETRKAVESLPYAEEIRQEKGTNSETANGSLPVVPDIVELKIIWLLHFGKPSILKHS